MKDTIIIFDLDGTLIDTNTLIQRSFEYVFKKHKPDYTLSEAELLSFCQCLLAMYGDYI